MTDNKTKILTAIIFGAVILLSLLLTIKNSAKEQKVAVDQDAEITESGSFAGLNPLEQGIILAFRSLSVPDSAIQSKLIKDSDSREITVDVPLGKPMEEIIAIVQSAARKTTYAVEASYYSAKKDSAAMQFSSPEESEKEVFLTLRRTKETIYFKQNLDIHLIIMGLDTASAKTRLRYLTFDGTLSYEISAWSDQLDSVAHVLDRYKQPLIVKIPLESKGKTVSNEFTLRIDDAHGLVESKINDLTKRVPTAIAISNDGGERFLDTRGSTADLFETLKNKHLIFLDRRTNASDKAQQIANHAGIDYLRNVKELEGESTEDYTQELRKISLSARKEITIWANATPSLITALERNSNYFEKTGVTFTGITELPTK